MTHALAQLRHLYAQLLKGHVEPQAEAAKYLLGPAIETLEAHESDLAALRAKVEELAGRFIQIAETHEANAEEWRKRSTVMHPQTISVVEREAMSSAYRAAAADLRSLLPGGDDASREGGR